MKTNILYLSFFYILFAVSLCGCSNDDEPIVATTDGTLLTVIARADGFASTDGIPHTRASESDYTTTFVKGDQIGVFAVKNGSIIIGCKNVPCTYNGMTWSGTVYECTGATYFAYYPYDENLETSGITSASDIVAAFNTTVSTATDQSTYAKYTACDLMTATAASPTSGKTLTFTFTHQMSLIEISLPEQKCKSTDDANAYEYFTPALGATFSLTQSNGGSTTSIQPCPMGNGIYRYIVPAGTSGVTVSGEFNTADSKTIEYTKSSLSLSVGNYKRLNLTYNGSNNTVVRALAVGDYYYSDGNICPGDASNPPSEGCIGVVYCVNNSFIMNNSTKKSNSGFTHGLVVALKDVGTSSWDKAGSAASNYGNTVAAPSSSSGWYLPNWDELKYICWGNNSNQSTNGKVKLNTQFGKLSSGSANGFDGSRYWSSTEGSNTGRVVYFDNGDAGSYTKYYFGIVRSSLAF